jgi:hypothetical protein
LERGWHFRKCHSTSDPISGLAKDLQFDNNNTANFIIASQDADDNNLDEEETIDEVPNLLVNPSSHQCNIFDVSRKLKESPEQSDTVILEFQRKLENRYSSLDNLKVPSKNNCKANPRHILQLHEARIETHLSIEQGNIWLRVIRTLLSEICGTSDSASNALSALPVDFKTIAGYIDKDILGETGEDLYTLKSFEWGLGDVDERLVPMFFTSLIYFRYHVWFT